ncbi:unnamed protein product [Phytomonas sp. EM1]|nr:unnamed protein product [Phytomonas sp. EM1]|eukprot:CCW65457.1 unnamed protein product [Phytomonas sp. isolate EM1]
MHKRKRTEENAKCGKQDSVDKSPHSNRRFQAFINRWREDVAQPSAVQRPSSMRPLCPLPTILRVLDPCQTHPSGGIPEKQTDSAKLACHETSRGTGVVYDEYMLQHVSPDPRELERPSRLQRTIAHLTAVGLLERCVRVEAKKATTRDLRRVHTREHIDYVDQLDFFMQFKDHRSMSVGQDLYACESTSKVARMGAGSVVEAALAVAEGRVQNAFAFVRPPGHHACAELPSGFCFFNNVAVAARAVQEKLSVDSRHLKGDKPHVLILDWDVHHCDGTESIFYENPSIMVISIHQYGKKRGHVLRKPPSRAAPETSIAGQAPQEPTSELSVEALGMLLPTDEEIKTLNGGCVDLRAVPETDTMPSGAPEKRQHKVVDYNQLAVDLVASDGEAAAMFGVNLSSSSATSSRTTSTDSARGSSADLRGNPAWRHAGDTEGLSLDSEVDSSGFASGEEPFYPGTGHLNRVGGEHIIAARGRNLNIPWPTHGMGDLEYLHVLNEVVVPAMAEFDPQVVFISCGFDSAAGDLLGSMNLTPSGYYMMTKLISRHCPRLVVALEGGYHVSNIALCSEAVLRALLEDSSCGGDAPPLPRTRMLLAQSSYLIESIKEQHKEFLKCFQ